MKHKRYIMGFLRPTKAQCKLWGTELQSFVSPTPCFRWGRRGYFASEQKFLIVINIFGVTLLTNIRAWEGVVHISSFVFFLLLFSNPFRNPSCPKIDQSSITFSFAFLPQDEKKTLWRNNMFFFFRPKVVSKNFFPHRPLMFFTGFFIAVCCSHLTLALGNHCNHQNFLHLRWAIITIIRVCYTCVGQSLQSSELVTLALVIIAITGACNTYEKQSLQS